MNRELADFLNGFSVIKVDFGSCQSKIFAFDEEKLLLEYDDLIRNFDHLPSVDIFLGLKNFQLYELKKETPSKPTRIGAVKDYDHIVKFFNAYCATFTLQANQIKDADFRAAFLEKTVRDSIKPQMIPVRGIEIWLEGYLSDNHKMPDKKYY